MRHVGELFKIVMEVTGGKDGGGGGALVRCDVCSVFGWGGGCGGLENHEVSCQKCVHVRSKTCIAQTAPF